MGHECQRPQEEAPVGDLEDMEVDQVHIAEGQLLEHSIVQPGQAASGQGPGSHLRQSSLCLNVRACKRQQ